MATAQTGMPQWFYLRNINRGTNVDEACANGQENTTALAAFPGTGFATTSTTITAGPTTTGPVMVCINGIWYAIPFNTAVTLPNWVRQALGTSGETWTFT